MHKFERKTAKCRTSTDLKLPKLDQTAANQADQVQILRLRILREARQSLVLYRPIG